MRDLKRNQRKMYYSLYVEQGNDSDFDVLDTVAKYSAPVEFKASLTVNRIQMTLRLVRIFHMTGLFLR